MAKPHKSIAVRAVQPMREGSRIAAVKVVFEKRGELCAFRKGAALRLTCLTVERFIQAWRKAGFGPLDSDTSNGGIHMARLQGPAPTTGMFWFIAIFEDDDREGDAVAFGPYATGTLAKDKGVTAARRYSDDMLVAAHVVQVLESGEVPKPTSLVWKRAK